MSGETKTEDAPAEAEVLRRAELVTARMSLLGMLPAAFDQVIEDAPMYVRWLTHRKLLSMERLRVLMGGEGAAAARGSLAVLAGAAEMQAELGAASELLTKVADGSGFAAEAARAAGGDAPPLEIGVVLAGKVEEVLMKFFGDPQGVEELFAGKPELLELAEKAVALAKGLIAELRLDIWQAE